MVKTIINIGTINIGTIEQAPGTQLEFAPTQLNPDDAPDTDANTATGEAADKPAEEVVETETVSSRHQADEVELEKARIRDRHTNLQRVLERSEEFGNRQGHLRTSSNPPGDGKRTPIRIRNSRAQDEAQASLELACKACRFAGRCGLKGDFEKWYQTKPYKEKSSIPKYFRPQVPTETRNDFRKALKENPEAHCDPKKRDLYARKYPLPK